MSESVLPTPGPASRPGARPIVVELSTRRLPARMRLGGLRRSIGTPVPNVNGLRRLLMIPATMMTRLLSR